ncbi:MAG: type III pantothenate kinase [Xanthomonadales bacterium]|nr:type III pantothenate kinase [Xanthomonadales bacterium]
MSLLLVDLGNSRLKWRRPGAPREEGAAAVAEAGGLLERWRARAPGETLWLASVAREPASRALAAALAGLGFGALREARVEAGRFGIVPGYAAPAELGVDRWLGLVAAREQAPCVVALAGSCLTLDALDGGGRHLPGPILPGASRMAADLAELGLRPAAQPPSGPFARGTGEAVALGLREALVGAILRFRTAVAESLGRTPTLVLGGGEAAALAPALPPPLVLRPALVLDGLERLARAEAAES